MNVRKNWIFNQFQGLWVKMPVTKSRNVLQWWDLEEESRSALSEYLLCQMFLMWQWGDNQTLLSAFTWNSITNIASLKSSTNESNYHAYEWAETKSEFIRGNWGMCCMSPFQVSPKTIHPSIHPFIHPSIPKVLILKISND